MIIIATLRSMSTISFSEKDERLYCAPAVTLTRRGDGFARLPEYGLSPTSGRDFLAGRISRFGRKLCARSRPDHEGIVAVFGHLPPKIFLVAESLHRSQDPLEVLAASGGLGVDLV